MANGSKTTTYSSDMGGKKDSDSRAHGLYPKVEGRSRRLMVLIHVSNSTLHSTYPKIRDATFETGVIEFAGPRATDREPQIKGRN